MKNNFIQKKISQFQHGFKKNKKVFTRFLKKQMWRSGDPEKIFSEINFVAAG